MSRLLGALACLALCGCSTHPVLAGRDEPPVTPRRSAADSGSFDAAPAARDAGTEPVTAIRDAAVVTPARDASVASRPPRCTGTNADCDADASNGCESDLSGDPKHCGTCGVACQYPDCACRGGVLSIVCPAGRADCDGDERNGCEVDIDTSMENCGSCNRLCHTGGHDAITAECIEGHCKITCEVEPFGQGDCDDNPDNGCETNLWTNENCGACGVHCTCLEGVCN